MKRLVVKIHADVGGGDKFYLDEANSNIPNSDMLYNFDCDASQNPFAMLDGGNLLPSVVKEVGNKLFQQLSTHPAVLQAITTALQTPPNDTYPIYIQLQSPEAERLPWETLCDPQGKFLALERQWPIGRITAAPFKVHDGERIFDPPLRLMAILSAAGVKARPEWDAIYTAVTNVGMHVKLSVLVGETDLKQHIEGLNNPDVVVDFLPALPEQLLDKIAEFAPNILHFFCHGDTVDGPHLLLATRADWTRQDGVSSIALEGSSLNRPDIVPRVWLVTLNCCLGAAAIQEAQSLARSLVANGFPAVVGMREVVASTDAHAFCEAFYQSALSEIKTSLNSNNQMVEICWAKALCTPRKNLRDRHGAGQPASQVAAKSKEWTLPVLYVQRNPFNLQAPSTNATLDHRQKVKLQNKLAGLRQVRDQLAARPGMPAEVIADFDQEITDLQNQLYPV